MTATNKNNYEIIKFELIFCILFVRFGRFFPSFFSIDRCIREIFIIFTIEKKYPHLISSAKTTGCGGRLNKPKDCNDESRFKVTGEHKHAPDARVEEKAIAMDEMKTLAKTTDMRARDIIAQCMPKVSNATSATIVGPNQLVQNVNRKRQDKNAPKNPKSLAELSFGEKEKQTSKGVNFILYDSFCEVDDNTRTIIFGTMENLKFLAQCTAWFMDGTFKVAPQFFTQLYTIHGSTTMHYSNIFCI